MSSPRAWDDLRWREKDNAWTAGCRWLQSWWRENQLGFPAGELSKRDGSRRVASMLPLDAPRDANFLVPSAAKAVDERLAEGNRSGIVDEDRLRRNLLSSQPACFNLFGPFVEDPQTLLPWVQLFDTQAERVFKVRFEWAPDRSRHFGGGSAFDVFVDYGAGGRRFLGIECKYAEDLAATSIKVREPYVTFTDGGSDWREGASRRLDVPRLRQLWLNTLLAQSLVRREETYESGTVVVVACRADGAAREATGLVRAELHHPDVWLRWCPYEEMLDSIRGHDEWVDRFRRRYLDFGPVAHLLPPDDPRLRRDEEPRNICGLRDLLTIGQRVTGEGSVLEQIVRAVEDGRLPGASTIDVEGVGARAAQLADDLKAWRQAAYEVWQHIESK